MRGFTDKNRFSGSPLRRESPSSREITGFPQVLCWLALYFKRVRREAPIDNKLPPRCFQHPVGRNCCLTGLLYLLTLYLHYKKALRQLVLTELRRTLQNCNVYGLCCYFLMALCLTLFPGKWSVAQVPWPALDVIVRSKFSWAIIFLTKYRPIPVDLVVWWPFLPEKPLS